MNPDLRLAHIAPISARTFYLRATSRAYDEQGADLTLMLRSVDGQWGSYHIEAPSVSHCAYDEGGRHILSLSPFGQVHVGSPAGFSWEEVDTDPATAPNRLRHMRAMARVGQHIVAVGMARMAYLRSPDGRWQRIDQQMRTNSPTSGLLAVDGCDEQHIVACGFGGEVWQFDGRSWSQLALPTNLKLEQVCVVSPELMAITGAGGAMFVCEAGSWRALPLTASRATLWGLAYFNGRFYAADNAQIYVLEGDELEPVVLPFEHEVSLGRLKACDGRLWSVGDSDLLVFDGKTWSSVACP
jgi:hypothetical protein